ncbi:MAG: Gfo/Idh/MocA family oxidoreductase [Clostridia bacterium]|nr:Gfo/Idh/MocA family oxidoreductase [Clostridia bacterium]
MLNACIVGFGAIGPTHAQAVAAAEHGQIYAICDCNKERADKGAEQYNCRALYDFDEVLTEDTIQVVHICTPHYLHVDMACRALSAGKHVVLEKPAALNQADLNRLMEAEKTANGTLCINLQNRFNNCIQTLLNTIKTDDSLGALVGVTGTQFWQRDEHYYGKSPWHGRWDTEGGSLLCNQALHLIDLMHVFAGKANAVRTSFSNKALEGVIETEDTSDSLLFFENGVRGVFFGSNAYTTSNSVTLELNFENVQFRYADRTLYKISSNAPAEIICTDQHPVDGKLVWGSGHRLLIDDFYRYLSGKGGSYISLESALPSAKTLLAMYESGKNGGKLVHI